MEIYLIRHAAAAELDKETAEDGFRYLSLSGRAHSIEVAQKLKDLGVSFDLIVSSPLVRAVQTAEIFSHVLGHKGEFKTAVELIGGASFEKFLQMLKRNSRYEKVACFGHSPDVNHYAVNLLNYDHSKEPNINFRKCSVCRIDYDEEKKEGEFVWFLKSDTMELIKSPL
jgi:phosphohistidine phosphatase